MNVRKVKTDIQNAFKRIAVANSKRAYSLVPKSVTAGKLYEAYVLTIILEHLRVDERFDIDLVNSSFVVLKSSPGPINRMYPHFELKRQGVVVAEVWTDIEFLTLSCVRSGRQQRLTNGDFHELDIAVVDAACVARPAYSNIWLGAECKNCSYSKNLLRELLGLRRELSLLADSEDTKFARWPRSKVPADPPSCLLAFGTDPSILNYRMPGETFGVDFFHERI